MFEFGQIRQNEVTYFTFQDHVHIYTMRNGNYHCKIDFLSLFSYILLFFDIQMVFLVCLYKV